MSSLMRMRLVGEGESFEENEREGVSIRVVVDEHFTDTRCILSKNTVYKNISLRFGEKIRTSLEHSQAEISL